MIILIANLFPYEGYQILILFLLQVGCYLAQCAVSVEDLVQAAVRGRCKVLQEEVGI